MQRQLPYKKSIIILCSVFLTFACTSEPPKTLPEKETIVTLDTEGKIVVNGADLYYRIEGKGEPLIVVHGGPGMDHAYLYPQLKRLASDYQLIFFDQRACGKSSIPSDSTSMTMSQFVADIEAVREKFGLEKINLLGHSWGGLLAMWYGTTHPDRLNSLILANSIGADRSFNEEAMNRMAGRVSEEENKLRTELIKSEAVQNGDSAALSKVFRMSFAPTFYNREFLDSLQLTITSDRVERSSMIRHLYPDLTDYDLHENLRKISTPVLIIHGEYDGTPLAAMTKLKAYLPQAKLITLRESGHFSYIESPDKFDEAVRAFLK